MNKVYEAAAHICSIARISSKNIDKQEEVRKWVQKVHEDATEGRRCLIWNHERKMWWKRNKFGHSGTILEAGRFSLSEAIGIIGDANRTLELTDKPEDSVVII